MTMFLLHDGARPLSIGSVVADPLPAGVTAVALTAEQAQAARDNRLRWTPQDGVTILPPDPSAANADTIRQRLRNGLDTNTTFLALASPTQAQVLAQVRALTRENNGLIRPSSLHDPGLVPSGLWL